MSNLFILGFAKCGTTALADYMVKNDLAHYLIENVKEPHLYGSSDSWQNLNREVVNLISNDKLAYLDASVGYIINKAAIDRLPHHHTKIIICLRNQFQRTWSAYKMFQISLNSADASKYKLEHPHFSKNSSEFASIWLNNLKLKYPASSHLHVEKYFNHEIENLKSQTFLERIAYEISFFLRRSEYPFLSILSQSFYAMPIKYVLSKFHHNQVSLVMLDNIRIDKDLRRLFFKNVLNVYLDSPDIPMVFSSDSYSTIEDKPNFLDSKFDFIRNMFNDDLNVLEIFLQEKHVSDSYIDKTELLKYVRSPP